MKYQKFDEEFIRDHAEEIANITDIPIPSGLYLTVKQCAPAFKRVIMLNQRDFLGDECLDLLDNPLVDSPKRGKHRDSHLIRLNQEMRYKQLFDKYPNLRGVFKYVDYETWINERWGSEEFYHKRLAADPTLEEDIRRYEMIEDSVIEEIGWGNHADSK